MGDKPASYLYTTAMARCRVDPSISRVTMDGFDFPLGCYPVEPIHPVEGFTHAFEPADGGDGDERDRRDRDVDPDADESDVGNGSFSISGGDDFGSPDADDPDPDSGGLDRPGSQGPMGGPGGGGGEWEEWPDRYVWDVLLKSSRLDTFLRALFSAMPGRVYPILDALGNDAFREIDPYVAYELVGMERFLDALRRFRGYLMEDGFIGFGVMSEDPFFYVFIDEHKVVTIRAEASLKERVESILAAFDLKAVDQLTGADSAVHEHRGVLDAPPDRPDLLTAEEIVEELRDTWGLELNIDPHRNVDDQGHEIGVTGWRCVVRLLKPDGMVRYLEVCLTAGNLMEAHDIAVLAAEEEEDKRIEAEESAKPVKPKPPSEPPQTPHSTGAARGRKGKDPAVPSSAAEDEDDEGVTTCDVVVADRLTPEQLEALAAEMSGPKPKPETSRAWATRWEQ